jgi:hypothetical protein
VWLNWRLVSSLHRNHVGSLHGNPIAGVHWLCLFALKMF